MLVEAFYFWQNVLFQTREFELKRYLFGMQRAIMWDNRFCWIAVECIMIFILKNLTLGTVPESVIKMRVDPGRIDMSIMVGVNNQHFAVLMKRQKPFRMKRQLPTLIRCGGSFRGWEQCRPHYLRAKHGIAPMLLMILMYLFYWNHWYLKNKA